MAIATTTAIALALAAASAGAAAYNTHETAKKQDSQLASQLRAQASKQHEADAKTAQLVTHEGGLSDDAAKGSALAKFTQAIQANKGAALKPLATQGAVSDAYKKSGSDAALGITNSGGNFADLVSSIDAPMQTRKNDQRALDDYGIGIDQIKRFSAGDDFLAQMKLRGIRRNPWIDAASSAANSYAGATAGGGYGGTTAPTGGGYVGTGTY